MSKLSIYRDITEIKRREQMLHASREDFRNLFEHIATGVFISSKEGKFLFVDLRERLKMERALTRWPGPLCLLWFHQGKRRRSRS